jgi:hypothetical protein
MCIENTVTSHRIGLDEMLIDIRKLRQYTAGHEMSEKDFSRVKSKGRP